MAKKQKLSGDEQDKTDMEKMQQRVENMLPPKADIPASISIQQAEELKVRISELEAKLSHNEQEAARSSAPNLRPSKPGPTQVPPNKKRVWRLRGLSLSTKLPLTVILLLALAFLIATSLSVRQARESLTKTLGNDLIAQASLQAELVRSYLTWTRGMAIDLAAASEAASFDEATILATIRQTLQRNEQIFGSTIAYEPYQFQSNLYYWSPYYSRASDGKIQFTQLGNAEYNYFKWDWYTLPKQENAPVLSPPYFDEGGGNIWMVTWSVPFYDSAGKFKGVATTDMSFQQTQEIVRQIEVGRQGYAFLINQDGTVLGIGDQGRQYQVMEESMLVTDSQEAADWNNMLTAMTEGKSGFVEVTDPQGKPLFVAYEPIGLDTGWYLGLAFPQTELFEPAKQLQTTLVLLSILVAMIASVVLFFFTRSITLPIQQLASRAKLFSQGQINLSQAEPIFIQTHDELEELGNAFNQMISELAIAFQNLEDRVADRTHDLELASEVGRTIAEKVEDVSAMLTDATEMIRARFNLYYTQVYLLDPSGQTITLHAGTGVAGQQLLQRGHHLLVSSSSLNGRAVSEKKPVIVADTEKSNTFLPNPLLPKTRSEMAMPLLVGDKVLGVLDMQSEFANALNEDNVAAFQVLAGQLSVAIQNAALFAQSEETRKQLEENVRHVTTMGWLDFLNGTDRGEKIGYIFDQTEVKPLARESKAQSGNALSKPITVTGAIVGTIQVAQNERDWTTSEAQIVQSTADQLAQHIESLRLLAQAEKYRQEAEQTTRRLTREGWEGYLQTRTALAAGYSFSPNEVKTGNEAMEIKSSSTLSLPITVRDEAIGELMINAENVDHKAMDEIFSAVATQLGDHIENLRLSEQNEKRAYELATVATVSTTASTVLDPDKLLQAVVDLTKERFNIYHAHIYLTDESWNTLLLAAGAGEIGRQMVGTGHAIPMDMERSLVARASRERKSIIVNDVRGEAGFLPNPMLPETRAEMAVPMIMGDKVLGVFDVQADTVGHFTDEDANIYTTLALQVAVALQNARLYVEQAATVTQLRELDRLKSSFLANMSHELRTPLNSILGFADVMLEELDGPLTENMSNDLSLIHKNGQHLLHLINDVLDMAKIDSGKMNLNIENFNMQETIEEVVRITSPLASDKNLTLLIEPDSDHEVKINADKIRVRQVMINLINNAMKFTEEGRISIRVAREENTVLISVKDTGIGIPADLLESVFQEFTQVDTSTTRKEGGTGLGLPISRRLIEMHSGRLWAESNGMDGEGATFYVSLPIESKINM